MKVGLFDFQEDALTELRTELVEARSLTSIDRPRAVSFSAPTGAGKTIILTALFEDILFGEQDFDSQPDAVILWISDMPELNEQTRLKIESKSDRIHQAWRLVSIDANFDTEQLEGGHIYFLNTQKLGSDKALTRKGDGRQHSLWETLTNTAKAKSDRFYVVIDEAHRGMRSGRSGTEAQTIMQRFLLGSPENGLCPMPLVIGVSATPRRFDELLGDTTRTVQRVRINAHDVRESGLLKDRTIIHYPEAATQAEMTLLSVAASHWKKVGKHWESYCMEQDESLVHPILVVQVEDGIGKSDSDVDVTDKSHSQHDRGKVDNRLTRTDLATSLLTIEDAIGRDLREGEVAHTFNDVGDLLIGNRKVMHIDASRIEENKDIGVVLFKMSLSTGWDCPRAEVMMSFRRAKDHTYIAQLLGRMVRSPLARRIEADASLNDVHLFLPHYNQETVTSIIEGLNNVEDVPPSETGTNREMVTLYRLEGMDEVFNALDELVTYRVNAVRKQSSIRRLMKLGRGLTTDSIDKKAQEAVKAQIVGWMGKEVERLKSNGSYEVKIKEIKEVILQEYIAKNYGADIAEEQAVYHAELAPADIERLFNQAGRQLGEGLHITYWKDQGDRDAEEVKIEVIVLVQNIEAMTNIESQAEQEFDTLYSKHKRKIAKLKEQRCQYYERLCLSASDPQPISWKLPKTIDFNRPLKSPDYDKHLYLEENGSFHADLGTWEREVLEEELADETVVAWLRNLDRKSWSLEIPCEEAGSVSPMFPDLLIVRQDSKGYQFDILEPHDPSRNDNVAKARALAKFAEKHWKQFSRIELIRRQRGSDGKQRYYRLNVGSDAVRRKVNAVETSKRLDEIFEMMATLR